MILEMDPEADMFKSDADALVNPVNIVGVMGVGLAAQFKAEFPDMFQWYQRLCEHGRLTMGQMSVWTIRPMPAPRFIINFPTKMHWADPSRLEYITTGLKSLVTTLTDLEATSVAVPALGCGHGGLEWESIKPRIVRALTPLSCNVYLYPPKVSNLRKPDPGRMYFSH